MVPLVSIYVGGILTLLMAVFHTRFYSMFNWSDAFGKVDVREARVLYTIHLARAGFALSLDVAVAI